MTISTQLSDKLPLTNTTPLANFFQKMANRLIQGQARYGEPSRRAKYMTRLEMEVKAYKKTGNSEHLYNAANYCFLEWIEPEHKNQHEDNRVESVTRGRV